MSVDELIQFAIDAGEAGVNLRLEPRVADSVYSRCSTNPAAISVDSSFTVVAKSSTVVDSRSTFTSTTWTRSVT